MSNDDIKAYFDGSNITLAENHHITPESGRVLAALLERATTDTMEDLNGWYDMSQTATCLLNDYFDQLKAAKLEIVSLCPSLEQ